jgi:hypothetical protein
MNLLTLFKEIISVCGETQNPSVQNAELMNVKVGGTYSYHWALKG